jgi:hypothetical protein
VNRGRNLYWVIRTISRDRKVHFPGAPIQRRKGVLPIEISSQYLEGLQESHFFFPQVDYSVSVIDEESKRTKGGLIACKEVLSAYALCR